MKKKLFEEFQSTTASGWKQKIQVDLKGADYNETLITTTPSGIHIKPFYHSDTAPQQQFPYRATYNGDWYISQAIYAGNESVANKKALDALERGSDGILFMIPNATINLKILFDGLPEVGIQVHPQFLDPEFLDRLYKIAPTAYVHLDIIYQLASDGNWFENKEPDHEKWNQFISSYDDFFSNITINTGLYQSAGATVVQELAYYLSHLNEYLNHCEAAGISLSRKRINIDTTIGHNYFMEIAKYRAYRVLTKALGDEYGLELEAYITATPSLRNKSLKDYNVNMLRTTTECMSAVLGGADTVHNLSYDAFFNKSNEFGERISRNQLRILKDEAYFNKVQNTADGAYYISSLVEELTHKSLQVFKSIENAGGFVQSLFDGTIQRKIKESDEKERKAFNAGDRALVGVNKFENKDDQLQTDYELYPFVKQKPRKTLIQPIVPKRLAEDVEQTFIKVRT